MSELQTKEEYISEIREFIGTLENWVQEFRKMPHLNARGTLLHYFAYRAAKIGKASLLVLDLDVPLAILCRVLCEDFINIYWAIQSEGNAHYYHQRSISEMGKVTRRAISRYIEQKKRKGEPAGISLEPFEKLASKVKPKTLADMAKESGLEALYDHVYRTVSLDVHGHKWGTFHLDLKNLELVVLSELSTLLLVTVALYNRGQEAVTPKAILEQFGIEE